MSENLKLWEAVERTDPKQTKAITGKPYKGTSPKPYYLVQKATETFGPCGIGWGFTIVSERVEDGSAGDKVHIAHVRLWYVWNDKRGEVEHVGQTMFAGKNKNGPYTDEDAPKKSITDALVKALSMVGFAGDIFMGRYDDSKYVQDLHDEARTHSAPPHAEGSRAQTAPSAARPAATLSAAEQIAKIKTFDLVSDMLAWANSDAVDSAYRALSPADQTKVSDAFNARQAQIEDTPFAEAAE